MHSFEIDKKNNICILKISGFLDNEELNVLVNEFRETLEKLDKDFVFINDITEFVPPMDDIHIIISEAMKLLNTHKPKMVIRVSNEFKREADDQYDKAVENAQPEYKFSWASTMEEALKLARGES